MNYFKIIVMIKDRAKPLGGIRRYPTDDYNQVYEIVKKGLLKYYYQTDIIKIDVWWMPPYSEEVKAYLKNYPDKVKP